MGSCIQLLVLALMLVGHSSSGVGAQKASSPKLVHKPVSSPKPAARKPVPSPKPPAVKPKASPRPPSRKPVPSPKRPTGKPAPSPAPAKPTPGPAGKGCVKSISAGSYFTAVLLVSGKVKVWGRNIGSVLGQGLPADNNIGDAPGEVAKLSPVDLGPGLMVKEVYGGAGNFACAVFTDARVKCWGADYSGQLGIGDEAFADNPNQERGDVKGEMGAKLPYLKLGGADMKVAQLALGDSHACAVLLDGGLACWGSHLADFETGRQGSGYYTTPVKINLGAGKKAVSVSCGAFHTAVLLSTGAVINWGNNGNQQLSSAIKTDVYGDSKGEVVAALPNVLPGTGKTISLCSGYYFNLALRVDAKGKQTVWGWGSGDSCMRMGGVPKAVITPAGYTISSLRCMPEGACLVTNTGKLLCWGSVAGSTSCAAAPQAMNLSGAVKAVTGGLYHQCALGVDGNVRCYGGHTENGGQLGYGDTSPKVARPALPVVPIC